MSTIGNGSADEVKGFLKDLVKFYDNVSLSNGQIPSDHDIENFDNDSELLVADYGHDVILKLSSIFGSRPAFCNIYTQRLYDKAPVWFNEKHGSKKGRLVVTKKQEPSVYKAETNKGNKHTLTKKQELKYVSDIDFYSEKHRGEPYFKIERYGTTETWVLLDDGEYHFASSETNTPLGYRTG